MTISKSMIDHLENKANSFPNQESREYSRLLQQCRIVAQENGMIFRLLPYGNRWKFVSNSENETISDYYRALERKDEVEATRLFLKASAI